MVTVDLLQTWIHKGVFDPPRTGEDPPFQFLHQRAERTERQPGERPYNEDDGPGEGTDSYTDDDDDSISYLSDMTGSQTSKRSYVSAGDETYQTFVKQLEKNGVRSQGALLFALLGLDVMDDIQKFRDRTKSLTNSVIEKLNTLFDKMSRRLQWHGPTDEARFQGRLEPALVSIIDPAAPGSSLERYEITNCVLWNRAPQVLYDNGWRDLSQPKVDVCFYIASEQSDTADGLPLHSICKEVYPDDPSEAMELLSLPTLARFLSDPGLANACFVPFSQTPQWSLYPISIFEIKASADDLPIARNQIVNAGVFQCGKQIDLILQARKYAKSCGVEFDYEERIVCLGMSIAGTVWQIDVVYLPRDLPLNKPKFNYEQVIAGDWEQDVEGFIGAVMAMHQYMLHRIVKLLVATYKVFKVYQEKQGKPVGPLDLRKSALHLPARTLPIPGKKSKQDALKSVEEAHEPDPADGLSKLVQSKLTLGVAEQAVSEQASKQA